MQSRRMPHFPGKIDLFCSKRRFLTIFSIISRIICDSWLCLDFPLPESGQSLLLKASNLRRTWNQLLANKLESLSRNADSELTANQRATESDRLEAELWQNLAVYMNCEIGYTLKRLLPADLKVCNSRSLPQYFQNVIFVLNFFIDSLRWPRLRYWGAFGAIQTESIRRWLWMLPKWCERGHFHYWKYFVRMVRYPSSLRFRFKYRI